MALGSGPNPKGYRRGAFGGTNAVGRYNKALLGEIRRADEGTLGLSQNEKERIADSGARAAFQQAQGLQTDLARQVMAGGNGIVTGQTADLSRDIAGEAAEAAAQSRVQADVLSQQLAEQRRQALFDRQERQSDRQSKKTAKTIKDIRGVVRTVLAGIFGGPMAAAQVAPKD